MNELKTPFRAYKVFNPDWTCLNKQYEVGKEYKETQIKICHQGIHACLNLSDCFNYYSFDSKNKVAEITVLGNFEGTEEDSKIVSDHIKIEKELSWDDVLLLCNSGNSNSGYSNSGNSNSGYSNSGNRNSGYSNSGNHNSGNRNSGNSNSGNRNSGDYNSGDNNSGYSNSGNRNSGDNNSGYSNSGNRNSGDNNSGDYNSGYSNSGDNNSGDYNSGDYNSGLFNTKEHNMYCFDILSDMKRDDWEYHPARYASFKFNLISFIGFDVMTEEEKKNFPEYKTIGGYLKTNNYKTACEIWWGKLNQKEKDSFKTLPNFNADIFYEITGIRI